ncbi:MAG: flagellin [Methylohalobius sp.]|nr:flagellin [Methylohalobius sp.]
MPSVINTNMMALITQRNLSRTESLMNTAMERLSSGLRINSAKDDSAGLAIATRFDSQVRGLTVAMRNAGDGISMAQTAEGALGSMTEMLQKIRELAVQAANATNSDADRASLNAEARQLVDEIQRIAEQTHFNGTKLLDGSFGKKVLQIGANAGETFTFSIGKLTTDRLGSGQSAGVSTVATDFAFQNGDLIINGVAVGASLASDDTASTNNASASAIAKAAAINRVSSQTGVIAKVNANTVAGQSMTSGGADNATVDINGVTISLAIGGADLAADRKAVVTAINAVRDQTGVEAIDTGQDSTGITLRAADGRNIEISNFNSTNTLSLANYGLAAAGTYEGSVTLVSTTGKPIKVEAGTNGEAGLKRVGLVAGTYDAKVATVSTLDGKSVGAQGTHITASSGMGAQVALNDGDLVINGVAIQAARATDDTASDTTANSSIKEASAIAIAAAINRASAATGVTATVDANIVEGTGTTAGSAGDSGSVWINGIQTSAITLLGDAEKDRAQAVAAINAIADRTGVRAEDTGSAIRLIAADGRNISIVVDDQGGSLTAANIGLAGIVTADVSGSSFADEAETYYATVTLHSAKAIDIQAGINGKTALENLRFFAGTYGGAETGQFLKDIDISTVAGANKALEAVSNALESINSVRGELGAVQNRLESTITNIQVNRDNLTASKSRIMDADFAEETTNLAKAQILQQAGIAMLAQAKQAPQNVLSLLR